MFKATDTRVLFWSCCDQVWLILSMELQTAPVEHVQGMPLTLRWVFAVVVTMHVWF